MCAGHGCIIRLSTALGQRFYGGITKIGRFQAPKPAKLLTGGDRKLTPETKILRVAVIDHGGPVLAVVGCAVAS